MEDKRKYKPLPKPNNIHDSKPMPEFNQRHPVIPIDNRKDKISSKIDRAIEESYENGIMPIGYGAYGRPIYRNRAFGAVDGRDNAPGV